MVQTAKIFLIPVPISEGALQTLSPEILRHTVYIKHFFVENIRTARRFLKSVHPALSMDEIQFSEIHKHEGPDLTLMKEWLNKGLTVGIMSESGCPGIADPGAELVSLAQKINIEIIPLTGPNSLVLALMASGLNGQSFCFQGYLPIKEPARNQKIKMLEQRSKKENQTQILIETPYRNNVIVNDFIKTLHPAVRLCIAQDITGAGQFIKTKTIESWKKQIPELKKSPAVFLFLAN